MSDLVRHELCPICGSREYWVLATQDELSEETTHRERFFKRLVPPDSPDSIWHDLTIFTNSYPARLIVCGECGLVCRDPRFSPSASIRAFSDDEYPEDWLESAFRDYEAAFSFRIKELVRLLGTKAKVLEIGSYAGGFLSAAQKHGWEATGVDVGLRVGEFCRLKGLDVRTGTCEQARLPDLEYDAVFVWFCFDQLPDPRKELAEIRRVLRDGGYLILQVPNGEFLKLLEKAVHLIPSGSIHDRLMDILSSTGLAGFPYQMGFTSGTISRLLSESGFGKVHVFNRTGIRENAPSSSLSYVSKEHKSDKKLLFASNTFTLASFGRLKLGPWIEIRCRKTSVIQPDHSFQ